MSITVLNDALFFNDMTMFGVFAGEIGTSDPHPTANLGNGRFRAIVDIDGVWDVDRVILVTRRVADDTILESARFFRDGVRLGSVTGIELSLDVPRRKASAVLFSGDDLITGNKWSNCLRGFDGDDTIRGAWGDDTIIGNRGRDLLHGLGGDDTLYGGSGNDLVTGGNENDLLFGGAGIDRIGGGTGRDTMIGGDMADHFVFREGDGRRDVITDFDPGEDRFLIPAGAEMFAEITLTMSGDDVLMEFADVRVRLIGAADRIGEIGVGDFRFE